MARNKSIYDKFGVPTAINAVGTKTRIGGTKVREEAAIAMREAAKEFVRISDLQAHASDVIADITGAEAGYVSSGASAGLTLCAAACIAGQNLKTMSMLPADKPPAAEILIPKSHRNSYDRAIRLTGAKLIEIGNNDKTLGPGPSDLEVWEIESAISDQTAAIAYVARNDLPLEPIIEIADIHNIPVMVDAAGTLPPKDNLTEFIEKGADLVIFSGGKAIRGPQSTGVIAGRSDLITSIALQNLDMDAVLETWDPPKRLIDISSLPGVPRQGLGRGFKVGQEEIIGLITALKLFVEEDIEAKYEQWHETALQIGEALRNINGVSVSYSGTNKSSAVTNVVVKLNEDAIGLTSPELVLSLRRENPRIFVGDHEAHRGIFTINPMNIEADEAAYLVDRIRKNLRDR